MTVIGTAFIDIKPDMTGFGTSVQSGMARAGDDADRAGSSIGSRFGTALKTAAVVGVTAAAAGVVAFGVSSVKAAEESQVATARLTQVFASMGDETGKAAQAAMDYASALSAQIGVEDETIMAAQAKLATFGAVSNEVARQEGIFDRATAAAADLAAAGFGDMAGNAVQLGKALQDPEKGLSALARSGVTFTDAQKDMITKMVESGDQLGAQKMILGAIESQVQGTAEATATASQKMGIAWGEAQEAVGALLLPIVEKLANFMTTTVIPAFNDFVPVLGEWMDKVRDVAGVIISRLVGAFEQAWPKIQEWLTGLRDIGMVLADVFIPMIERMLPTLQEWAGTVLDVAVAFVDWLIPALKSVAEFGERNQSWLVPLAQVLLSAAAAIKIVSIATKVWAAAQALLNISLEANPVFLIAAAIGALVAALVIAYQRVDWFRNAVDTAVDGIVAAWNFMFEIARKVFGWLAENWQILVAVLGGPLGAVIVLIINHFEKFKAAAEVAINAVVAAFNFLAPIVAAVVGFIVDHWRGIGQLLLGPIGLVVKVITENFNTIRSVITTAINVVVAVIGFLAEHWRGIAQIFLGPLGLVVKIVTENFNTIRSVIATVLGFIVDVVTAVVGFVVDHWQMLVAAITGPLGTIVAIITTNFDTIRNVITTTFDIISSVVSTVVGFIVGLVETQFRVLATIVTTQWNIISTVISTVVGFISGLVQGLVNTVSGSFSAAWDAATSIVSGAVRIISGAVSGMIDTIAGFAGRMLSAGAAIGGALIDGIKNAVTGAAGFAADVANALVNAVKSAWNTFARTVNDLIPNSIGFGPASIDLPDSPIPTFAAGGLVPGRRGVPLLAIVHGGEYVMPVGGRNGAAATQPAVAIAEATFVSPVDLDTLIGRMNLAVAAGRV